MILVGSRALALRGIQFREPKDFDFICTESEYETWVDQNAHKVNPKEFLTEGNKRIVKGDSICEFEIIQPGTSAELLPELVKADAVKTSFGLVPSVDMLFTLKTSHRHLKNSPHFWKTLTDYHRLKGLGAKVRPEYQEFLKLREKETYNYKHPSLVRDKRKFFCEEEVKYTYDHDSIHVSVARLDKPAYRYFSRDDHEVMSDRGKFETCSRDVQLFSVAEESAVLAVERSLVPFPGAMSIRDAWLFAFSKVCTSIASGWWRAFAYENAFSVLRVYDELYHHKFQAGLANGTVRPFK